MSSDGILRARASEGSICKSCQSVRLGQRTVLWAAALGVLGLMGCGPGPLRNLQRGCDQGSGTACFKLGVAYYEGKDDKGTAVDLDYGRARKAFEQSCARDNGTACNLGYMLQKAKAARSKSRAPSSTSRRAASWATTPPAPRARRPTARGRACVGTWKRPWPWPSWAAIAVKRDLRAAEDPATTPDANGLTAEVKGLIEGCDGGNADACFEAAVRFDDGKGVPQNKERAAVAYKVACEKGDLRGCHNLGVMQIDGEGIPRNVGNGFRLLDQACTRACARAARSWSASCSAPVCRATTPTPAPSWAAS